MGINSIVKFEYKGRVYDVPVSGDDRERFSDDLINQLEELDGIKRVVKSGQTRSKDSMEYEIMLETDRQDRVTANLRSLSKEVRSTVRDFVPASDFTISHTPTAIDAEEGRYETTYYKLEVWWY